MGSRAADKLKEIEELRASLGNKLTEIERRLPLAGFGKKVAAAVAGSSVAGSALGFGLKRMRKGRKNKKKKRAKDQPAAAPAVVTINVFPKGAAWLAAAGLAGWAGYKLYDALQQRNGTAGEALRSVGKPAVVKQMPEPDRQTGN